MSKHNYTKYSRDPEGFIKDVFKIKDIFPWQKEALDFIKEKYTSDEKNMTCKLAIAGGNNTGKSFFGKMLMLWHFATQENSRNIMMTNSERQTKNTGYYEIKSLLSQVFDEKIIHATEKFVCFKEKTDLTVGEWDLSFFLRANFESALTGLHFPKMFFFLDECLKFPTYIWNAIETMTISGRVMLYASANPLETDNRFHEVFLEEESTWFRKNVSLLDIPDNYYSKEFVESRKSRYQETDPEYCANVLGQFPSGKEANFRFSLDIIKKSFHNFYNIPITKKQPCLVSLDVAESEKHGSVNAVCVRSGDHVLLLESYPTGFTEFTKKLLLILEDYRPYRIIYDGNGIGVLMKRFLIESGFEGISRQVRRFVLENSKFADSRTEMAWALHEWLEKENSSLPNVYGIERILNSLYFTNTKDGKLSLISKPDLKKALQGTRLKVDILDALLYSFSKESSKLEIKSNAFVA